MRRRSLFAAAVPIAALVIAGCGGGGGETTDTTAAAPVTTPTLTKADLLKQGDAICAEVNAAVGTLAESSTEGASRVAQEADLYKGMVERLKGLGTPEEPEGYDQFMTAADELAQAQSDAALAAARGEAEGLETAETEASTALSSFQSAASEYGFEDCSEAPSAPVPTSGAQAPSGEAESETGGVEEEAAPEAVEEEAAPEAVEEEAAPETETGGAGSTEAGGGTAGGGGEAGGGGSSSGGIGPGE
jgi:hypothetical protein